MSPATGLWRCAGPLLQIVGSAAALPLALREVELGAVPCAAAGPACGVRLAARRLGVPTNVALHTLRPARMACAPRRTLTVWRLTRVNLATRFNSILLFATVVTWFRWRRHRRFARSSTVVVLLLIERLSELLLPAPLASRRLGGGRWSSPLQRSERSDPPARKAAA